MKRICTICARGGSKGVPNKNIRELAGKPLIAYSIEQAKRSDLFDAIAVSSDSEVILDVAKKWGATYTIKRPDALASDEAPKLPSVQHCLLEVEKLTHVLFNILVDLDASAPLRGVEDIQNAVSLLEQKKASNVVTGCEAHRSPYFNLVELTKDGYVRLSKAGSIPVVRRQDAPKCYDLNASVYVWKREALVKSKAILNPDTLLYLMPRERSIDIDSEFDFKIAELLLKEQVAC